jgi:hypothetical protein
MVRALPRDRILLNGFPAPPAGSTLLCMHMHKHMDFVMHMHKHLDTEVDMGMDMVKGSDVDTDTGHRHDLKNFV